ncbi:MAG: endonuclease MutS2 [Leptolyngbya sp. DLM2.Bin15]|nr:MAG: endonuclease MutS2 [Leptolyngbya sp. DLM2.Bin15]
MQLDTLDLLEWPRLCQHLATFTATKLGAVAARQIRIPTALSESMILLAQTQDMAELEQTLSSRLSFDGIQDIGDALERSALLGVLGGTELLAIATTLSGVRNLRRVIDAHAAVPTLKTLVTDLRTYPELEQQIHHCIDDNGQVADRANPALRGIRDSIRNVRSRIYDQLHQVLNRQANAVQEPVITQRGDRFVIPVKAPQKDAVPGIVHDVSASGATLYVEPQSIINLGNQIRQAWRQERVEEEKILRDLSAAVAAVKPDLDHLLAIATLLDLAMARARYGLWLNANPPRFVEPQAEAVVLRDLRHPLLVWQQHHEQGPDVVPISLTIQSHIRVVAITGPNTGGKTVTLKTLGLACLMAKAGLFVPAREPVEIPWFQAVLADIGDEQSIEQSLSTFSGHIRRVGRILQAIAPESIAPESIAPESTAPDADDAAPLANALVLLDEVGAGTDPSEGSALAIALLRYLADHTQLTMATTHFGELKALKYDDDRFENASVEFNDQTLSPTYRLLWGIPGRSNALAIAQRLGLDVSIIDQAREYVGLAGADDVNQVISGLEAQRRHQEESANATAKLLRQAERLHDEVSRKAAMLKERERDLQQQQEQAIQAAIAQAREEIAQVIRRLQRGPQTAQAAQRATQALQGIAEEQLNPTPKPPKPGFRPQVGDRVRIPKLGQTAEVLTPADEDGELTVRFGMMKMTVSLADVESLQGEKAELPKAKPAPPPPPPPPAPAVRTSKNTVDIRGSRIMDAEMALEKAIASAAAGPMWIIHGKGTGKLRAGVHEFLKHHPQITTYDLAPQSDGGAGVTIAQVK